MRIHERIKYVKYIPTEYYYIIFPTEYYYIKYVKYTFNYYYYYSATS